MALPAGVTTAIVTFGVPKTFTGEGVTTTAVFRPSVSLVHLATGTPIEDFFEAVTVAADVQGQITLPHTDQDGFVDLAGNAYKNWYYTAELTYSKFGETRPARTKVFQITVGQTTVDLDLIPTGIAAAAVTAPTLTVTSFNGLTGAVLGASYASLARDPDLLWVGVITRDANGAPTSADVVWPDGTAGTYTGTASTAFPGLIDSYTLTYAGTVTVTYTQPAVTRNAAGDMVTRPAITVA